MSHMGTGSVFPVFDAGATWLFSTDSPFTGLSPWAAFVTGSVVTFGVGFEPEDAVPLNVAPFVTAVVTCALTVEEDEDVDEEVLPEPPLLPPVDPPEETTLDPLVVTETLPDEVGTTVDVGIGSLFITTPPPSPSRTSLAMIIPVVPPLSDLMVTVPSSRGVFVAPICLVISTALISTEDAGRLDVWLRTPHPGYWTLTIVPAAGFERLTLRLYPARPLGRLSTLIFTFVVEPAVSVSDEGSGDTDDADAAEITAHNAKMHAITIIKRFFFTFIFKSVRVIM